MAGGGAAGAAAAAAIANAIKASGTIVRVESSDFQRILELQEAPLVVMSTEWMFGTVYRYLVSYKGLAFTMKVSEPIRLPGTCEVIQARKIWIPN